MSIVIRLIIWFTLFIVGVLVLSIIIIKDAKEEVRLKEEKRKLLNPYLNKKVVIYYINGTEFVGILQKEIDNKYFEYSILLEDTDDLVPLNLEMIQSVKETS